MKLMLCAIIATCAIILSRSTTSVAQFPFPNPFGAAKDTAVRTALANFGKAVGDQLPIVVSPSDALPTAPLPGPAFAPRITPNISASLRASADGTVILAPGDYAFTVDVFCMKAHAGSPSAHRYLVAPLHGSAADIFRALNSRAPSYRLDHHALQVLSWDIQAGLPYNQMAPPQRALADQLIPDFRQRLDGDVYLRIRSQYDQIVGRVPGMPSFDEALTRIGPTGQAVVEMQRLREEMAQPPPTFNDLVRQLIPFMPPEHSGASDTPWSRFSDRVYVRFITSGNYATPGTYQVRVLAAQNISTLPSVLGLGSPSGGAPVPFTNIVNNPGTPAVQPLTQAPQPGGGPVSQNVTPSPSPSPSASITSETVATEPPDRTRTTVGVGEQVKLTFSGNSATWSIKGSGGTLGGTGKSTIYSASFKPASETIRAVDTVTKAVATITFDVIAPSGLYFEKYTPGLQIHHHQGWPDIGFSSHVYLQPDTVSFQYIEVREKDAQYVATGYYGWMQGQSHNPASGFELVGSWSAKKGWSLSNPDDVWSGEQPRPFIPGYEAVDIPWEYTDASHTAGPYEFAKVQQRCQLMPDGKTLYAQKANASIQLSISSSDYR